MESLNMNNIEYSSNYPVYWNVLFVVFLARIGQRLPTNLEITTKFHLAASTCKNVLSKSRCTQGYDGGGRYRVSLPSKDICNNCDFNNKCPIQELTNGIFVGESHNAKSA